MTVSSKPPAGSLEGPGEAFPFPEKLVAHVVEPGPSPRLHGFDVEADLARSFRFGECVLLALTGEEPEASAGRAFEVALTFAMALSVADGPVHAAVLARLAAGRAPAVLGAAGVALAEHASSLAERVSAVLAWLDGTAEAAPDAARARSAEDRAATERLRAALAPWGLVVPGLDEDLGREAAVVAVLHACGVRKAWQIEAAFTLAGLPVCAAEAAAVKPYGFKEYPFNVPPFAYVGGGAR